MIDGRIGGLLARAVTLGRTAADLAGTATGLSPVARARVLRAAQAARSAESAEARAAFEALGDDPETLALARVHVRAALHGWRAADALERADAILRRVPGDRATTELRATALRDLGRLSEALVGARAAGAERLVRDIEGTLNATSDAWRPDLAPRPGYEPVARRVMNLVDRSLPHWRTGYSFRTASIARAQRQAGLDPFVVTRLGVPAISGTYRFARSQTLDGIRYERLIEPGVVDVRRLPRDTYIERYAARAAELVERARPAVIHAASANHNGLVGIALKRAFGIPLIYEVRNFTEDFWVVQRGASADSEAYTRWLAAETRCMREADRVVVLSEHMRARLAERDIDPAKVVVIGNAIEPERFAPRAKDPALAASLGLGDGPVVGYISSMRRHEDFSTLVRAVKVLRDEGVGAQALLVGDGPMRGQIEREVAELGLQAAIVMPGWVAHERILDHYALIDVFVTPRLPDPVVNEVTPLKPFEALAMGIPSIVSDLPALREVVGDEERGLAFFPGDAHDLAKQIRRTVEDPAFAARLAEHGRAWVTTERTWSANGAIMRKMVDELT